MKQFNDVSSLFGAPMGRLHAHTLDDSPKSIRLFKVRIDAGGYDDGGAYWGHGTPLWCARGIDGEEQFVRANSRTAAAAILDIPNDSLKRGLNQHEVDAYFRSFVEGRMPPSLLKAADWREWFDHYGYSIFDGSAQ